jgi:hypothetical protein
MFPRKHGNKKFIASHCAFVVGSWRWYKQRRYQNWAPNVYVINRTGFVVVYIIVRYADTMTASVVSVPT